MKSASIPFLAAEVGDAYGVGINKAKCSVVVSMYPY